MTLDLQSASGTNEKLGQITATFTLMPKTNEDRQEVCVVTVVSDSVDDDGDDEIVLVMMVRWWR